MVALSGKKRREYAEYEPTFWREAENSDALQLPFLDSQIARENNIVYVHEREDNTVNGFVIATLHDAPPVYAPGGLTCVIDDFAIADSDDWQNVGGALLQAVNDEARARGAVHMVVVCGHRDEPKRRMLATLGYHIASEWYVRNTQQTDT